VRRYATILLILVFSQVHAQKDSGFVLVRTYEGDIADAAMDNLDNLYIVSSTGQIKKFNADGDSVGIYNQVKNFGRLQTIDVTNPLKILLFYKDFSTVVVLDRFLANMNTLDLRKSSILQPAAIGLSYDDHIWVFDEYDNKLKKVDQQGNRLSETADLRSVFSQGVAPQKIISDNGLVYLADTTNGIFIFDNYGSFKKRIALRNWQSIAVNSNRVISTDREAITVYNTVTFMQTQKKYPFFQPYFHSFAGTDKFVSFSPTSLHIYRYRF
jgi:hypothetical protein